MGKAEWESQDQLKIIIILNKINKRSLFLAVQDSSIGDLVTH